MAEFALMEREQRVDGSPEPYAKSVLNLPLYYCALLAIYAFTKNKIEVLESMAALTAIVWVAYMVVGLIVVIYIYRVVTFSPERG